MNKLPYFFMKMAIIQLRMVQIPKFWCLKLSTNIWVSVGDINSIPKIKKKEEEGKKGSKPAKIVKFFELKKLKLHFLKICLVSISKPIIRVSWYTIQQQNVQNLAEKFFFYSELF